MPSHALYSYTGTVSIANHVTHKICCYEVVVQIRFPHRAPPKFQANLVQLYSSKVSFLLVSPVSYLPHQWRAPSLVVAPAAPSLRKLHQLHWAHISWFSNVAPAKSAHIPAVSTRSPAICPQRALSCFKLGRGGNGWWLMSSPPMQRATPTNTKSSSPPLSSRREIEDQEQGRQSLCLCEEPHTLPYIRQRFNEERDLFEFVFCVFVHHFCCCDGLGASCIWAQYQYIAI